MANVPFEYVELTCFLEGAIKGAEKARMQALGCGQDKIADFYQGVIHANKLAISQVKEMRKLHETEIELKKN